MSSTTSITTIHNGGNMSRYEMLEWMNGNLEEHITRIEDLCTGVAYCRMMESIFPGSINMKRVKITPRRKFEYKHNLRLLQEAFNRLELEQPVPIELIIQGRFKHNFEFIQFFKKFYDSQTKSPQDRKLLAPKWNFKASRILASRMKASFKTKSGVEEDQDLESQGVPDEAEFPEDPENIMDIRAKWMMQIDIPVGPHEELTQKLLYDRDIAYHKLLLIERELEKVDKDKLSIYNQILDVLKAEPDEAPTPVGQTPVTQPSEDQTPVTQPSVDQTPVAQPSVASNPEAQPAVGETPMAQPSVAETPEVPDQRGDAKDEDDADAPPSPH